MKKNLKLIVIAVAMIARSPSSYAESEVESLSPALRTLLSKEMLALQDGMKSIFPAYISGDMKEVSKIANKMKNSYILKQNMTHEQKHELMTKLPKSFLQSDQKFHEYAGMLQHVAEEKHFELVGFYYSKLTESCVSCHSEHASHRFPAFKAKSHHEGDHHGH